MDYPLEPKSPVRQVASPVPVYADYIECPSCAHHISLAVEGLTWRVTGPRDIAERLVAKLSNLEREELWVITMNQRHMVTDASPLYRGSVNTSQVRIGELFQTAVKTHAAAIALCHTHPGGGEAIPSPDDLTLTAEAVAAGRLLDIQVLDHLIVTSTGHWTSLRDRGIAFSR